MAKKPTLPDDAQTGLYALDQDGNLQPLMPGTYTIDDDGAVGPALNWQVALEKIQWDKVHMIVQDWGKRTSGERVVNLVGMYILVAGIVGLTGYLGAKAIIEGQALVGFLGAALGYLLARGRTGGFGGN